jgi:hypothetical protein
MRSTVVSIVSPTKLGPVVAVRSMGSSFLSRHGGKILAFIRSA